MAGSARRVRRSGRARHGRHVTNRHQPPGAAAPCRDDRRGSRRRGPRAGAASPRALGASAQPEAVAAARTRSGRDGTDLRPGAGRAGRLGGGRRHGRARGRGHDLRRLRAARPGDRRRRRQLRRALQGRAVGRAAGADARCRRPALGRDGDAAAEGAARARAPRPAASRPRCPPRRRPRRPPPRGRRQPSRAEIAATAIIGPDSVEVMPAPGSGGGIALGSISYAEAGDVTLAGFGTRGLGAARLRRRPARRGGGGRRRRALEHRRSTTWRRASTRLRIDQLAADGKVASRVETPFQRDFPRAPPPRPGEAAAGQVPPGGPVTVQPGNNLWTLRAIALWFRRASTPRSSPPTAS